MFDSCSKKANFRCNTNVWDSLGNAIPMDYVGDKYFASGGVICIGWKHVLNGF